MRRIIITSVLLLGIFLPAPAGAAAPAAEAELSITCDGTGIHTARLYRTLFGRQADEAGLAYWVGLRRAGLTGEAVAYWMTQGSEYHFTYQGLDDREFVSAVYRNLLGREADPSGHAYWLDLVRTDGRHSVASWMTQTPEFAERWPFRHATICAKATRLGLTEVLPGLVVGKQGSTVTVLAERTLVSYDAVDGGRTHASRVSGDVVVNANWFVGGTSLAPVVENGRVSGTRDTIERGQILTYEPGCGGHGEHDFDHVWMGEIYAPDSCVSSAVSGVSLIHKGVRSDAYPGIDITNGYTNVNRAHSFIGFNDDEIVIISTRNMTASRLADYAISLGVTEGVMLDGGGSTQIKTPSARMTASRAVTSFAVLNSIAK